MQIRTTFQAPVIHIPKNDVNGSAAGEGKTVQPPPREARAMRPLSPFQAAIPNAVKNLDTALNQQWPNIQKTINASGGTTYHVPAPLDQRVKELGKVTGDRNIEQHFANFLSRLDERNQRIATGTGDVPRTDGEHYGSPHHIGYGQYADQHLEIGNPALAAMLNPSGGKIGPGNKEVIPLKNAPSFLIKHGQAHDAAGGNFQAS
jgi:hypothetical protein